MCNYQLWRWKQVHHSALRDFFLPMNHQLLWMIRWMGQRNPKHQLRTVVNIPLFIGFQPSKISKVVVQDYATTESHGFLILKQTIDKDTRCNMSSDLDNDIFRNPGAVQKSFESRQNSTFWLPNRRNVLRISNISNENRWDFPIIIKSPRFFRFSHQHLTLSLKNPVHQQIPTFPIQIYHFLRQIYHFLRIFPIQISHSPRFLPTSTRKSSGVELEALHLGPAGFQGGVYSFFSKKGPRVLTNKSWDIHDFPNSWLGNWSTESTSHENWVFFFQQRFLRGLKEET